MKKTKLIVALLISILFAFTFVLTACPTVTPPPPPGPSGSGDKQITLDYKNTQNAIETFKLSQITNIAANTWGTSIELGFKRVGFGKQIGFFNAFDGFKTGTKDPSYTAGTQLNIAIGYNNASTSTVFDKTYGPLYTGGPTYNKDDLKPAWAELERRLDIEFKSLYQNNGTENEIVHWINNNFTSPNGDVHVSIGNLTKINEAGRAGNLVNLLDYLDYMPNFRAFLEANPLVYLSLIANTDTGAFYAMPYFDGNDDIERYFMMRVDWVAQLLDGTAAYAKTGSEVNAMNTKVEYEAYMPTTGSVDIDVANKTGGGVTTISKDYDAALAHFKTESWYSDGTSGNIADISAAYRTSTGATYEGLVNVLRKFIDIAYDGYYSNTRSELFCGANAAWDADEMVALLHCVMGSSYDLSDIPMAQMTGIFSRDTSDNQRVYDLVRMGAGLFGARGLEARHGNFYFDSNGQLQDSRQELSSYEMALKMNSLFREGLVQQDIMPGGDTKIDAKNLIQEGKGFMMYDYCQTQTLNNMQKVDGKWEVVSDLEPVVNPVALWYDGENIVDGKDEGTYMRFTESWRSVKSDGACITTKATGDQLMAALAMFDYFYTKDGKVLLTYGPDEFIELKEGVTPNDTTNQDRWVTININGQPAPKVKAEIADPSSPYYYYNHGGGFTGYARQSIGATYAVSEKMQSFELQLTDERGVNGSMNVSTAIAAGVLKHPLLSIPASGPNWYTSIPTTIATTTVQDDAVNTLTAIAGNDQFFHTGQSNPKTRYNIYIAIIRAKTVVDLEN